MSVTTDYVVLPPNSTGVPADGISLTVADQTVIRFNGCVASPSQPASIAEVDAFGNQYVTDGGQFTVNIGADSGITVIKAAPGRLCRVILQAANGSNAVYISDNATTIAGTVLGYIPASAPAGVYNFQTPAQFGITIGSETGVPQMTVSYS